jgi:hypothetical protein
MITSITDENKLIEKIPETNGSPNDKGEQTERKMTKRVCAWCQKNMGEKEGDGGVTHGICEDCAAKMEKELEDLKSQKNSHS